MYDDSLCIVGTRVVFIARKGRAKQRREAAFYVVFGRHTMRRNHVIHQLSFISITSVSDGGMEVHLQLVVFTRL